MPEAPSSPMQCEYRPVLQLAQWPQDLMQEMMTRSPTFRLVTEEPTSVIVPTPSWPRIRPFVTAGTSPLRIWRSVPQIVVVSTLTITSLGFWILGSGTSVQDISPGPPYTRAFM